MHSLLCWYCPCLSLNVPACPCTGLITIGILYSSPVSNVTVLTLQIDVLESGEYVEADFKMPICLNMTAMEEAPSWFGRVSAEVEEQTHTS